MATIGIYIYGYIDDASCSGFRGSGIVRASVLNSFQTSGNSPGGQRCCVGIPGFGTVGSALARRLTGPDSIPILELTHICDRRAREKRAWQSQPVADLQWTD